MHIRKVVAAIAMTLALALGASAQTAADAGTPASPSKDDSATKPSKKSRKSSKKKKTGAKKSRKKKKTKTPPADGAGKALESATPPPAMPVAPPAVEAANVPDDNEPPLLTHTPVSSATKGKPFVVTAHATDPVGVFGPVLFLRKKGLPATDFIPLRMLPSKTAPGDYTLEIPAALVSVDALEYYIEAWDNAGNGPARAGSPESPFLVKVEEEKKIIVKPDVPAPPTNVVVKQKGAPPAITHTAVTQAAKGQPIEVNARLVGDTGVQGATVMFRHAGEKDYKALPMGNVGGDDYTATVPGTMANADIEYYLEAFDKFGNGPGRSGGPSTPYLVKISQPAATAPVAQAAKPPEEPPARNTLIGLGLDAGAPGGGGFTLLVRPLWWLRLNAGLAYNYAGLGYRGGISLAPCWCAVTPTLNLDAGHYLSGDFNKFATVSDPNERTLLSHTTYTFATAQIGLEFGSQRWFNFYLRGGLTYLTTSFSAADLTALAQGKISGDPSTTYKVGDGKFTSVLPCVSLGFNIFVY